MPRAKQAPRARTLAHHAWQIATGNVPALARGQAWWAVGRVAAATGIPDLTEFQEIQAHTSVDRQRPFPWACFAESLRILTEAGLKNECAQSLRVWALYAYAVGDSASGQMYWQEARQIFMAIGAQWEVEQMDVEPQTERIVSVG